MDDRPTPDRAVQPCTGPDGHAPPTPERQGWLVVSKSNVPIGGHLLIAAQAIVGEACIIVTLDPGEVLHAASVSLRRWTLEEGTSPADAPFITITATAAGEWRYTYRLDDLTPSTVSSFIAVWDTLWRRIGPGRPAGSTAITRTEYEAAYQDLKPQYPRRDGRNGLVEALAARLFVSPKTIRRLHKNQGFPL